MRNARRLCLWSAFVVADGALAQLAIHCAALQASCTIINDDLIQEPPPLPHRRRFSPAEQNG
jgi:hypothetical protein